jgi:hypothetical protein
MELGLQLTIGVSQLASIELEALSQPEQLEMIHPSSSDNSAGSATTLVLNLKAVAWTGVHTTVLMSKVLITRYSPQQGSPLWLRGVANMGDRSIEPLTR